jgi:D-glycero-D-manno-heptose 1,7-bisphosphate phosphatase
VPVALEALRRRGFLLIVVTNQPDVSRGTLTRGVVAAINARLQRELPLNAIMTCFHDSADACDCRKPRPGLLLQAARQWDVDLASSYMVGDRASDVAAGARAGCATLFVDCGYSEPGPPEYDFRVQSLTEAAAIIIGRDSA